MIDWGGGFFLGLKFCFVLIALTIEFYFLVFGKHSEGDIGGSEFAVLSGISVLCIVVTVIQVTKFSVGLWLVIPVPLIYAVFRVLENVEVEKIDNKHKSNDVRNLEEMIAKNPDIPETYVTLGDIYFKHADYVRALRYYRKSHSIKETAEVQQKIKITDKERRIQKGEIWVCGECGTDNPGTLDQCKACGNSNRPVLSIKMDLIKNKQEIKKWIVMGFGIPFGTILFLILLKSILPVGIFIFLAICISLAVIYVLLRIFFTW